MLKKHIREDKNISFSNFLANLTYGAKTDYSLWRATKRLKRPVTQEAPLRSNDGKWVVDPKDKAKLFAEHLAKVFKPYRQMSNEENCTLINKIDELEIPAVTMDELKLVCSHNSKMKSPGYDLISGEIIKELSAQALKKLQHIINVCFVLKYVPHH